MRLKVKIIKLSAGIPVALLNEKTANKVGVHTQERVSISTLSENKKKFSTIIDTFRDHLLNEDSLGVSSELRDRMGLKDGQLVDVVIAPPSRSVSFIKKKLSKKSLSEKEISEIIRDIVYNSISEAEISLFVSAMYQQGMSMKETIFLIKAILKYGSKLNLKQKLIVDKHSIGGIPGNRTTPIVVSICAAAGLTFPKTSSRAITSAAGTADVIETIARVDFSVKEIETIIKKTNACLVWCGALGLVPADARIITIEKLLKIDPEAQLLASIMAKKLAVGSEYILIDIPYGKGAKVDKTQALNLKKKFEYLGKYFNKKLKCVLTDGRQPIGNGVGPVLELIDVIKILDPNQTGPRDLEDKSLFLAGNILELTGKAEKGKGPLMAMNILDSGKAFEKFKQIIKAQDGDINRLQLAKYKKDIIAKHSGKIIEIQNKQINTLARVLGCPVDKSAGIYLFHHFGEHIRKGEKILTLYSQSKARLKEAIKFLNSTHPIIFNHI